MTPFPWAAARLIEQDWGSSRDPALALNRQGEAVAVWSVHSGISANRFVPGQGWGETEEVLSYDSRQVVFRPKVVLGEDGQAMVVWLMRQSGGSSRLAYKVTGDTGGVNGSGSPRKAVKSMTWR